MRVGSKKLKRSSSGSSSAAVAGAKVGAPTAASAGANPSANLSGNASARAGAKTGGKSRHRVPAWANSQLNRLAASPRLLASDRLRRLSPIQWALLVSVGVHAALLGFRFANPEGFNRVFQDTPLEVVLVNARSSEAPTVAQAIAQANLTGGGEAKEGRATSPLPASPTMELGDTPDEAKRQIDRLQEQQQQLLTQLRREIAQLPPPDPRRENGTPEQQEQDERRRQLIRLLAEIEKRVNEENARPKKRYISPATREEVYALYYDALRRRVEDRGTRNFPEHQGRKLYGELVMNVTVDALGRVVETEVVRSSKSRILDQRAVAIVLAAAPFGPFSTAMRIQADQIVVTSRFRFTREDGLETTLAAPAR